MTEHTPTYTEVSGQANVHVLARIQRTEFFNSNAIIRRMTCVSVAAGMFTVWECAPLSTTSSNHLTTYKTKKRDSVLTNVPKRDLAGMKRLGDTKPKKRRPCCSQKFSSANQRLEASEESQLSASLGTKKRFRRGLKQHLDMINGS